MSNTIVGVIIGGLIGIIPSLVIVFVEYRKEKERQKFELRLEHMRSYETARRVALEQFSSELGSVVSDTHSTNNFGIEQFYASAKTACLYLSDDTISLVRVIVKEVAKFYGSDMDYSSRKILLNNPIYAALDNILRDELQKPPVDYDDCAGSADHKCCLKHRKEK